MSAEDSDEVYKRGLWCANSTWGASLKFIWFQMKNYLTNVMVALTIFKLNLDDHAIF